MDSIAGLKIDVQTTTDQVRMAFPSGALAFADLTIENTWHVVGDCRIKRLMQIYGTLVSRPGADTSELDNACLAGEIIDLAQFSLFLPFGVVVDGWQPDLGSFEPIRRYTFRSFNSPRPFGT